MRVDCPHCGRQGKIPDGVAIPSMVRCPQCENKFQPIPTAEAVIVNTATAPATKDCHYCGEQILVVAKKCRHCGEILDVSLRAAEEAKMMARSQHQPLVINNNVSSSAVSSALTVVGPVTYRRSILRSFGKLLLVSFAMIIFGVIMSNNGAKEFGAVIGVIGMLSLLIGVPFYLIKGVWRIIFG